jgi:DNA polymerase-3 subunit gamma/tau
MSLARASINAALEAARAASRMPGAPKRPPQDPAPEPAAATPAAAPAPAAPPAGPAPGAPAMAAAPSAPAPAPARPAATAPWDASSAQAGARAQAMAQPQAYAQDSEQAVADDGVPDWVTGFSDDTAVARSGAPAEAPAAVSAPQRAAAPTAPPHAYVITPVPEIGWDGNWPALAAGLPLRGVSQQLALQTELIACTTNGGAVTFRLRVPVDTLRASGNSEKLCAAVQECFPSVRVNIDTEIGPVWYTASAEAKARREQLQREAEDTVGADPFVRLLEQTFDAFVVPGSVRPIAS